jgi:hypothetical protein
MASTNKTTNYDLSQYVGTDKPTYLSDYNSDMFKIDAQMKENADDIATAVSSIETITTTATTALTTAQSAETTANSANTTAQSASTTAGNAQSTANSALATATSAQTTANTALSDSATAQSTATSALTSAQAITEKLNLSNFETIVANTITRTGNGNIGGVKLNTAANADGSVGKIYGQFYVQCNNSGGKITIPTQLRPKNSNGEATDITVNGVALYSIKASGDVIKEVGTRSIVIKGNGNVEIEYEWHWSGNEVMIFSFMACLLFLTPFNDEPIPPIQQ